MEKTCANHPESMALATCKACDKSICLMCVLEEREGTFCSDACIRNLREVSDWVGGSETPAEPAPRSEPDPEPAAPSSIFEEMPDPGSSAEPAESAPETAAAVQTPRAGIGNPCATHPDIRAKAFCATCKRAICGLCIVETAAGMFCSEACSKHLAGKKGSPGLKVAVVLVLLAVGGAGVWVMLREMEKDVASQSNLLNPNPEPIKPDPPQPPPQKPDPVQPVPPQPPPQKPDPVKPVPPKPPPPKPEPPKPTRLVHPWAGEEPGTWYRIMTTQGGSVGYTDYGLKSRTETDYVLLSQECKGGKAGPVQESRIAVTPTVILGEEMLEIEGRPYPCEIRATRATDGSTGRSWILMQGRHTGAVMKTESSEGTFRTQRVWEHTPRVNGRVFECLVVEGETSSAGSIQPLKTWFSGSLPLGALKIETGATSVNLVDYGDDWSQRPSFPK